MSKHSFLENKDLKFIFFGGKGGTGKTTSSASTAMHLAKTMADKKILILSTDPAHSLGDSFGCEIGDRITPIKGFNNLYGFEMDARRLLEDFKKEHQIDIFILTERVQHVDKRMIREFFSLSLPGMDEVMAIIEMSNLLKSDEYDLIIFDTAPTGHTLNLLKLPDLLVDQINVMEESQTMYRYTRKRIDGRFVKDEADKFLDQLREDVKRVKSILTDPEKTEFVPVIAPEAMSVYETERLVTTLKDYKIRVKSIIVNGVSPYMGCDFCISRKKAQDRYLKEISEEFSEYGITKIPWFPHEIRGIKSLEEFAGLLFGKPYEFNFKETKPSKEVKVSGDTKSMLPDLLKKDLKLILFGGKGGVGKTSCSTATALHMAKIIPNKVLILSTDPVHALSDSLGYEIGDNVTRIKGFDNLYALEIDAKKVFDEVKQRYMKEINMIIDTLERKDLDLSVERGIIKHTFSITPPGLDELMALNEIIEFIEEDEYDLIILDTAPTGHMLRLLELPDMALKWFDTLIRWMPQYKSRASIDGIMKLLEETKKDITDTRKMLMGPEKTEFVIITIAEAMGMLETEDLLASLRKLKVSSKHIIVNRIIPSTKCMYCSKKRGEQQKYLAKIRGKFSSYSITELPMFPHEIRGVESLKELGRIMYGG